MGTMMICGHASQAVDQEGNPVCIICDGAKARTVDPNPPSLEGRMAKCDQCRHTAPSSTDLPFFDYMPERSRDRFYCGCRGWD